MSDVRYSVEFKRAAKKELDRLDGPIRARVLRKITALADDPRPPGVTLFTVTSDRSGACDGRRRNVAG